MARILQLVTELVVGGASLTMLDFAEDLAKEHELHVAHGRLVNPDNAAARRARQRFPTYELHRLDRPLEPRLDAGAVRDLNVLCRYLKPDVIHTNSSKAGVVGRLGAPSALRIRLHTIHGWGHTPLDPRLRREALVNAERVCALRTTKLIAVSREVADEGLALRIGRPDQYAVIGAPVDLRPDEVDLPSARERARRQLGLPIDAEVIGWVGRFAQAKDPRTLAEVIRLLLLDRHNAYAALVGDGPDRDLIEQLLHAEIVERRVLLVGERGDVRQLYPAFDVLVHTTLQEGHPRAVREALAARVPVVSARVGGTSELAADERLGILVRPGDAGAYVTALTRILDSAGLRAPIDDDALASLRAGAAEPYRQMRELYRGVLGDRGL